MIVGLIQSFQEVVDCWLSFSRYELIYPGVTTKMKIFVVGYVMFLLCSWFPFYSFLPLFVNVNDSYWNYLQKQLYAAMFIIPKGLFDVYFTGQFLRALYNLQSAATQDNRLIIIAYKSVVHTVIRWFEFGWMAARIYLFICLFYSFVYLSIHLFVYLCIYVQIL